MRTLTPERRELVERNLWWIPDAVRGFFGELGEEYRQVARLTLCLCAAYFDATRYPGATPDELDTIFAGYARLSVRRQLQRERQHFVKAAKVWGQVPPEMEDVSGDPGVPDHRGNERDEALALWCSDDARRARRGVDARARLLLYLYTVEHTDTTELGRYLGLSRARVGQLLNRARRTIQETRLRDAVLYQLRTGRVPAA